MKARVFLSCGQRADAGELEVSERVAKAIEALGFEPYWAIGTQTLLAVRENIFERLRTSDYFVFVDFKREEIGGTGYHRGSLFSHQEMAIASFLEIPAVIFQEDGVKPLDGMLGAIQANAIAFSDRRALPAQITVELQRRMESGELVGTSRNCLSLEVFSNVADAVQEIAPSHIIKKRHYHISVTNHHARRAAQTCFCYLEKATNLATGSIVPLQTVEFKWAGSNLPSVRISAGSSRRFDAFWFLHPEPERAVVVGAPAPMLATQLHFNVYADSTEFYPRLGGPGRYELVFSVMSDNFEPARKRFLLEYGTTLESVVFRSVNEAPM